MENESCILQKLADILCSPLTSFEILPGDLEDWIDAKSIEVDQRPTLDFPFLLSDGNLGVPKKVLYKLYLAAVALFGSARSVPELCRVSTCAILLTNPAHQTALNARKRLIFNGDLDPEQELWFVEVLFRGSSLCAKESLLWDHRRWLFRRLYEEHLHLGTHDLTKMWPTSADLCPLPDIPPNVIIRELSIVQRACASHPRNYHAWAHWSFLVDVTYTCLIARRHNSNIYMDILMQELVSLINWVNHHVSDHSAVFRLCCLGRLLDGFENDHPKKTPSLVKHAYSLLTSYPSHESLWIYLRDSAALLPAVERRNLLEKIGSLPMLQNKFCEQFISWTDTHLKMEATGEPIHLPHKVFQKKVDLSDKM